MSKMKKKEEDSASHEEREQEGESDEGAPDSSAETRPVAQQKKEIPSKQGCGPGREDGMFTRTASANTSVSTGCSEGSGDLVKPRWEGPLEMRERER